MKFAIAILVHHNPQLREIWDRPTRHAASVSRSAGAGGGWRRARRRREAHLAEFYLLCEDLEGAAEHSARMREAAHALVAMRPMLTLSGFGDLET